MQDRLQKILPLGPNIAVAFAGDVAAAEAIIRAVGGRLAKDERLRILRKLASELPRLAKHFYKAHSSKRQRTEQVILLLAGIESNGVVRMWALESPNFHPVAIENDFGVFGSGAVIRPHLRAKFAEIASLSDAKARADALVMGLEAELAEHGVKTVGGMMQVILLDDGAIRPYGYGYVDLDPGGPPDAKQMRIESGTWIQRDIARGQEVRVARPEEALRLSPRPERFHDYEKVAGEPGGWAFLNYFLICLGVRKPGIGTIEFDGLLLAGVPGSLPSTLHLRAPFSFRSFTGPHRVEVRVTTVGETITLYKEDLVASSPIEDVEGIAEIVLRVKEAQTMSFDLFVDGRLLGHRPMLLVLPDGVQPADPRAFEDYARRQFEVLEARQVATPDIVAERDGPLPEYFVVCGGAEEDAKRIVFRGMLHAVFSNTYPRTVRFFAATKFRTTVGEHAVRLELVNAASHDRVEVTREVAKLRSSFLGWWIHGDIALPIPSPGLYYLNLYVDDKQLGSAFFFADTDRAQYSYTLLDSDAERVRRGEVIALPKGTIQAPEGHA